MPSFKIIPHLWYVNQAEEAARFYTSIFPDSRIDSVITLPGDVEGGPGHSSTFVEFTLCGQPFQAISAGPLDSFNHSVSFVVECEDQAEVDRYWEALGEGGTIEMCGWLRDRCGLSWQIVPTALFRMMRDPDPAALKRVSEAIFKMKKLDIAALESAYRGKAA